MKRTFLQLVLIAGLCFLPAGSMIAQTFSPLASFSYLPNGNNIGFSPFAGLVLSSNKLYGTTTNGGVNNNGSVFAIYTDGTGLTNLYRFTPRTGPAPFTNIDGSGPQGALILSGNTLYGTATAGGTGGAGTVFRVNVDGTGFTNLHSFMAVTNATNADGANPEGNLALSGNVLYGTATDGGPGGDGTVFQINTDGTGFTNVYVFTNLVKNGAYPEGGFVLYSNALYGENSFGTGGAGTLFKVNIDGTGFTNLHTFTGGSDDSFPMGLSLGNNVLLGTAYGGYGSIFMINPDGTGYTNLYRFTAGSAALTNSDGAVPTAGVILVGNTLLGTTTAGGAFGKGTVFAVNTNGGAFTNLHNFTATSYNYSLPGYTNYDGLQPNGLVASSNAVYGTARYGGNVNDGTVFRVSFTPQLALTPSGNNVILTWPTNVAGFDYTGYALQSTTNLAPPAAWNPSLPFPSVISGQETVTNAVTGVQQFYRLSQ